MPTPTWSSRSSTPTTTSSSSTSRRAWSSIPGPGHQGSTLVHGLLARFPDLDPDSGNVGGGAGAARARPPPRQGDLRAPGGGPHPGCVRLAGGAAVHPHRRAALHRPRVAPSRACPRRDRRAGGQVAARPPEDDGGGGRSPPPAPTTTSTPPTPRPSRRRSSTVGSRPDGPTRSGSTSARSAIRWSATLYGGARQSFPMPRPFLHARELAFIHPGTGDAGHVHLAAARGPGPGAGPAVLNGPSVRRVRSRPARPVRPGSCRRGRPACRPRAATAHAFAHVAPDGEQHALALVVARAVGVGLAEVAGLDRAVDRRDDLGQGDLLRRRAST